MGDTYNNTKILVSDIKKKSLWDRGQLIDILLCNRTTKNTIAVGPKNETSCGF